MSGRQNGRSLLSLPLVGLPIELLKHLLEFVPHRDLPACCRVSKLFHNLASPLLYRRLWLRDQKRLHKVFTVLGSRPHLSALVRVVEIRVFPFGLAAEDLEALELAIISTFKHAVNLEELIWTRTGSLNDRVLRTIFDRIARLKLLELTGDSRSWSPALLIEKLPAVIERLSLVMPDRAVTERIPLIAQRLGPNLQSLSILSNNAAYIRDASIEAAAPFLTKLSRLSLVGCKNVTGAAILTVLTQSQTDITELSLEGLSLLPQDVDRLSKLTPKLRTLAITHPSKSVSSADFYMSLGAWVEHSEHLSRFTFYRMSGEVAAPDEEQDVSDEDGDEDEDEGVVQQEASHSPDLPHQSNALQQAAPNTSSPSSGPDVASYNETENTAQGNESAAIATEDSPAESLLPFSSLQIDSPYLQRFRDQPYQPQAPTGTASTSRHGGGGPSDPLIPTAFLLRLIHARGAHLTQLRIHRLAMTVQQLGLICHNCPQLEDLVVHLFEPDWNTIKAHLASLPQLRSLHILASLRSGLDLTEDNLRCLAASSSDTLRQVGFRNRVWEITAVFDEDIDVSKAASETTLGNGALNSRKVCLEEIDEPASAFRRSLDP
ncbi:hypothetical protein CF319_g1211 [Tilletia indica]|uniref:Uncharacterized protein n=1 Tax=Tilletia indica TaxID=43049 RepID=A0A177T9N1_9BASI|nr:hypothetical protein CF319_g1211 [Tilletia indica]KAE8256281.1 hypothetical protein A4X13_0g2739 [Tilletia indica]